MEHIADAGCARAGGGGRGFVRVLGEEIWEGIMISVFRVVYYCWLVYLRAFGIFVLGYMNSALLIFSLRRGWRGGRGWGRAACIW